MYSSKVPFWGPMGQNFFGCIPYMYVFVPLKMNTILANKVGLLHCTNITTYAQKQIWIKNGSRGLNKLYFHVNHLSNFEKCCKTKEKFSCGLFCSNNNLFLLVTYFPHGPNKDLGKVNLFVTRP